MENDEGGIAYEAWCDDGIAGKFILGIVMDKRCGVQFSAVSIEHD